MIAAGGGLGSPLSTLVLTSDGCSPGGAHHAAVVAAETAIRDGWEHDLGRVLDILGIGGA
jgi:hypothetical protein